MKADLVNGAVVGNYRVLHKLGEYPEFVSYSATPLDSEQEVVLKAMRQPPALIRLALPDFQGRTTKFTQLNHPQLCPVREIIRDDQSFYIVSELNRGQMLEELIRQRGRYSYPAALSIVNQVLDLLTYLHEQKITCCDLRPTNLYLDEQGKIQLADAGLIQLLSLENQTTAPETISALEYTAPERILYSKILGTKVDARADLYAVGVLFYELLTGRAPLTAENRDQMIRSQIEAAPLPLRTFVTDVPLPVEQIIFRALEKSPERRFAAAETMRTALQRAQAPTAELTPLEPSLAYMMEALQMADAPTLRPKGTATGALPFTGNLPTTGSLKTSLSGSLRPEPEALPTPVITGALKALPVEEKFRETKISEIPIPDLTAQAITVADELANPFQSEPPAQQPFEDPITEPLPELPQAASSVNLSDLIPVEEPTPAQPVALDISADVVSVELQPDEDSAFDELRAHVRPSRWKRKAALAGFAVALSLLVGRSVFWMSRSRNLTASDDLGQLGSAETLTSQTVTSAVAGSPRLPQAAASPEAPPATPVATPSVTPTATPEMPTPTPTATPAAPTPAPKEIVTYKPVATEPKVAATATPKVAKVKATPEPRAATAPVAPPPAPLASQVESAKETKPVRASRPTAVSEKERRKRAILKSLSQ